MTAVREVVALHGGPAPRWRRLAARLIDGVVVAVPVILGVLGAAPHIEPQSTATAAIGVMPFVTVTYHWICVAWVGATVGKAACGIRVVAGPDRRSGTGLWAATRRSSPEVLIQAAALLGPAVAAAAAATWVLVVLDRREGRSIGDRLAGTAVVAADPVGQIPLLLRPTARSAPDPAWAAPSPRSPR